MKFTAAFAVLAVLGLTGCAGQMPRRTLHWSRANTTQDQFMKDRYACMNESRYCDMFEGCLGARGYVLDEDGTLAPPAGMKFYCQQRGVAAQQTSGAYYGGAVVGALGALSQGANAVSNTPIQPMPVQQTTNCYTNRYGFATCTTH